MAPLRREWSKIKGELAPAFVRGEGKASDRAKLSAFHEKLAAISVLDPACGSGNFLYISLQLLLDLEKELITFATQLGFKLEPRVKVQQLKAIELNAYAFELAQVSVQIGYLKWRRDNGFPNEREPVLQNLENFQNEDALLVPHFRSKPKSLKEAQAGEHAADDALKFYTERKWPTCDVIVSNPPFLGGSKMWQELGREYQSELWRVYEDRVPGIADLCCYWFEKARDLIEHGGCKRAGLLATQGIRGGANREVLNRIKETGDIFFAISDRDWILDGAAVHVSMIGFDDGSATDRLLDGRSLQTINANLTAGVDVTKAATLSVNLNRCFIGSKKAGEFEIDEETALQWLTLPNPHGRPNSDVLRKWVNGNTLVTTRKSMWIIDAGASKSEDEMSKYEAPFAYVQRVVKPERDKNKEARTKRNYWIHKRPGPEMREALAPLVRCIAVVRHSKHLIFSWLDTVILPDDGIYAFADESDFLFGILASRVNAIWAFAQGTQVREKESGFRYTPKTCFETFPLPDCNERQKIDIAAAAKELNELRGNWLNPPEWTTTRVLEFPGSIDGPWSRFVVDPDARSIGTVRYPRMEPRDTDCAKKLAKRTLTNLYNERPAWLAHAHAKLDAAVAAAYVFVVDLTNEQILEKLLTLNIERANDETKSAAKQRNGKKISRVKSEHEMI
jgi:type II restriction/modification system DNA methylase subunit YeeA